MRWQYNEAAVEQGWGEFPNYSGEKSAIRQLSETEFTCTVVGLFSKSLGKMPDTGKDDQIIMEYEFFTDMLANTTTFRNRVVPQQTQK